MSRTSRLLMATAAASILVGTAQAASAADLPMKAPPPMMAAPAPYNWTGFYVGGFFGAGWGTSQANLTSLSFTALPGPLPLATTSNSGFLGGGQVGYNYQSGWVVWGVEGDFAGTGIKGTAPCLAVFSCSASDDWLATVSGRVGGIVDGRLLAYVKGGGAWENAKYTGSDPVGIVGGISVSSTVTRAGWLGGMGVEYAFTPNWRGFIEYDYMDFGTNNVNFNFAGLASGTAAITDKLSVMKAGVNYAF